MKTVFVLFIFVSFLSLWLQFVHLTFSSFFVVLHIYCECKWVSWKIMCNKILFPTKSRNHATKRNAEARRMLGRWRKYKWQRILRIIKLRCNFYYPNLHFYCDDFFDWLFFLAVQLFPCEPTSGEEFLRSIISSPHMCMRAFSFLSKRSKGER